MKNPGRNKTARVRIRLSVPLLIVLPVLFVSVLIIYSIPALTEAKRIRGNLSFIGVAGSHINGAIEISMTEALEKKDCEYCHTYPDKYYE